MKKNKYLTKILATTGTLVVAGGTVATVLTLKNNKDKDSPPDEHLLGDDNYVVTDEQITQFFQDSREQLAANIVWLYSQPGPQHMEDDLIKSTVKQATGLYTKKFNDYQKQLEQEKQDKDFKEESDEPIIDDNSKKLSYLRSINDVVGVNPVD
jgi:hypothetical protein